MSTLLINPYRFGRPLLGRTFAPTSGANQAIGGGTPIVWAKNVDAVDPLNTFTDGSNIITVPAGATLARITARTTILRLNGSTVGDGLFRIRQNGAAVLTSPSVLLVNHSTGYIVNLPTTDLAVVASQSIQSVPETTSSAARFSQGTTVTNIDIEWYG